MVGQKAIQVGAIAAIMMICSDARYLLVNFDDGKGGGSNEIIKPLMDIRGNIRSNLGSKNIKKKKTFLLFIINMHCFVSTDVSTTASTKERLQLDHHPRSKVWDPTALGCQPGLTYSAFHNFDNTCHLCHNLYRDIEVYHACRYFLGLMLCVYDLYSRFKISNKSV
jgi:hypothetical protein